MKKEIPNSNYLYEIAAGDQKLINKLLNVIKTEFPEEKASFEANFKAKDFDKAAENVHKLKHKINIFGLQDGYEVAKRFEEELRKGTYQSYLDFLAILVEIETYLHTD